MKTYELTYILTPEITSEEAEGFAKSIESLVQNKEGIILKSGIPAAKSLSYRIKNQGSGFFANLEFQMEPEKIAEVKENLLEDSKILRSLIIAKNPAKQRSVRAKRAILEENQPKEEPAKISAEKTEKKVELKDIEQKLDEILGE